MVYSMFMLWDPVGSSLTCFDFVLGSTVIIDHILGFTHMSGWSINVICIYFIGFDVENADI